MCGITGAVWTDPSRAIDDQTLRTMCHQIAHRGPDDATSWISAWKAAPTGEAALDRPGVALGFRRLAIIDVEGARQPLENESGNVHLIFNGEIYNFPTLRRRLEGSGHRFATQGDGESIVHLYEDMGTDCFSLLNGMFAIAIWDASRRRLILARDRLGQKPLYFTLQKGTLAFASEMKCFAAMPELEREVDPGAIDEFLTYQYVPHPNTIYKQIKKLPPGHFAVFENGELRIEPYWSPAWHRENSLPEQEIDERLRHLLSDSIRLRLQSDVPLGAFLSGGIDSSLVVSLTSKILQEKQAPPIKTFSIGFPDRDFDETEYAAETASFVGSDHHRFEVQPDAISILDQLVWHYDEPFGDSSAVPTWYLAQETRKHVTVALSGDGGDELFAGYERYRALWLSQFVARYFPIHRLPGSGLLRRLPESSGRRSFSRKINRFFEAMGQSSDRRFMNWLQIFPERMRVELYNDTMIDSLPDEDPFSFFEAAWASTGKRDLVSKASLADLQTYLPCDLMTKVDVASMAHSLEVRQPMLDYRLVEFAISIPHPAQIPKSPDAAHFR